MNQLLVTILINGIVTILIIRVAIKKIYTLIDADYEKHYKKLCDEFIALMEDKLK